MVPPEISKAESSRDMYINRAALLSLSLSLSSSFSLLLSGLPLPTPDVVVPKEPFSGRNPVTLQVVHGEY